MKDMILKPQDKRVFKTTDSDLLRYCNKEVTIVSVITEADRTHDQEVLPMYVLNIFHNNKNIEAFADELFPLLKDSTKAVHWLVSNGVNAEEAERVDGEVGVVVITGDDNFRLFLSDEEISYRAELCDESEAEGLRYA